MKNISVLLLLVLIGFSCLDAISTFVFERRTTYKTQWLNHLHDQNLDFIVLGSSRAYTSIDIDEIENETGLRGLNLGLDASNPVTQKLILQLFLKNHNRAKSVWLEVDAWNIDSEDEVEMVYSKFMPYTSDPYVRDYLKHVSKWWFPEIYLPDWRYAEFNVYWNPGILILETLGVLKPEFNVKTGSRFYPTVPFRATEPNKPPRPMIDLDAFEARNSSLREIVRICHENGIKIFAFTAPVDPSKKIYEEAIDFKKLFSQIGGEYFDFSDQIRDRDFFFDPVHLNRVGAKRFTVELAKRIGRSTTD